MGLLNIIRLGVKIANNVTLDLQSEITYSRFLSQDLTSDKTYGSPIKLKCTIDDKQRIVRDSTGQLSQSSSTLTFLDINALLLATNGNGIKEDDKIILPNGDIGIILSVGGFIDRETKIPVATEVYLG